MADEAFPSKLHQLSTEVSRRRVVAGATTLAIATATSPAFSASIDGSTTMPDNVRFSNPDAMQKPPGYSHVVEVTGPGRTVYFAGQLGIDKSRKMGANAREQMEIAFENVKAALDSVGARFEHVVKLNNYISSTSVRASRTTARCATSTSIQPRHRPAPQFGCRN
jgi:enamine deaminase RidA (YjgF/YER057c/UK114 family)